MNTAQQPPAQPKPVKMTDTQIAAGLAILVDGAEERERAVVATVKDQAERPVDVRRAA